MRQPIQPPAHRVNVQINSHISTENAAAWREIVDSFGGSVEMSLDALIVQSRPGLRLSSPLKLHDTTVRAYQRLERVENADKNFRDQIEQDLSKLTAKIDVSLNQMEQAASSLRGLKRTIQSTHKRLSNTELDKSLNSAFAAVLKIDEMLESFDVVDTTDDTSAPQKKQ